jgi:hypothetical protein
VISSLLALVNFAGSQALIAASIASALGVKRRCGGRVRFVGAVIRDRLTDPPERLAHFVQFERGKLPILLLACRIQFDVPQLRRQRHQLVESRLEIQDLQPAARRRWCWGALRHGHG